MNEDDRYYLSGIEKATLENTYTFYRENLGPEREVAIGLSQEIVEESGDLIGRIYGYKNFWRDLENINFLISQCPELLANPELIQNALMTRFGTELTKKLFNIKNQFCTNFEFRFGDLNTLYINTTPDSFVTSLVTPKSHLAIRIEDRDFVAGSDRLVVAREIQRGTLDSYPLHLSQDETFSGILTLFGSLDGKSILSQAAYSGSKDDSRRIPLDSRDAIKHTQLAVNTIISAYGQVSKLYQIR